MLGIYFQYLFSTNHSLSNLACPQLIHDNLNRKSTGISFILRFNVMNIICGFYFTLIMSFFLNFREFQEPLAEMVRLFTIFYVFCGADVSDWGDNQVYLLSNTYNIARVLHYLMSIGIIMVHFSTYARPCVPEMTCANQSNSGFRRLVFTKFPQKWKKIVKNCPTFLLELSFPTAPCTT